MPTRASCCIGSITGLFFLGIGCSFGNPQGGQVAAGSASINTVPGTVTVQQTSSRAIINWQSFSIASGELTQFIQPSSASAVLNRVTGGNPSAIYGTLSANGQVYLINPNGILVGPGGKINTSSFIASTRDITNSDFLSGTLHFTGDNTAGVENLGTLQALGGDIYLIGYTVNNGGALSAANGAVGLAAGNDVLVTQGGLEPVTVNPTPVSAGPSGLTGVGNSGTITATEAELKAANGNIYALAINNGGAIRATMLKGQGGRIWLEADDGTVVNAGTLDASATAVGGQGGAVVLKSTSGTVNDSGRILAEGGVGGAGGNAEVSGALLKFTGSVNLTAPGGTTGKLLLDPTNLYIGTGGLGTLAGDTSAVGQPDSTIDPSVVHAALETADVLLQADHSIVINDALTWDTGSTLTLQTNGLSSQVDFNAAVTASLGTLVVKLADSSSSVDYAVQPQVLKLTLIVPSPALSSIPPVITVPGLNSGPGSTGVPVASELPTEGDSVSVNDSTSKIIGPDHSSSGFTGAGGDAGEGGDTSNVASSSGGSGGTGGSGVNDGTLADGSIAMGSSTSDQHKKGPPPTP